METKKSLARYVKLKTENTQRAVIAVVNAWETFLGGKRANAERAIDFVQAMKERKLSDATIKQRYQLLHGWYEFLVSTDKQERNPFRAVRHVISMRQKLQVRPTRLIPLAEVKKLLRARWPGKRGTRDKALVGLLLGTGMRRSEGRALNVGDIVVDNGVNVAILKHTKAGTEQKQPIPKWCYKLLAKLVTQRNLDKAENHHALFCMYNAKGKAKGRMSEASFYRTYKKRVGAAPHSARATYTTRLKAMGYEDRRVSEALRHATEEQVRVYDKLGNSMSQNVGLKIFY